MTREKAIIDIRDNIKPVVGGKSLDMAIEALEQEPCEDAISRQAVLELIADYDLSMGQVVKGIHALPSVKPQEPILDKIRAEIDRIEINGLVDAHTMFMRTGEQVKQMALNIIDKYKAGRE